VFQEHKVDMVKVFEVLQQPQLVDNRDQDCLEVKRYLELEVDMASHLNKVKLHHKDVEMQHNFLLQPTIPIQLLSVVSISFCEIKITID
jgi:hypothetical protein